MTNLSDKFMGRDRVRGTKLGVRVDGAFHWMMRPDSGRMIYFGKS